MDSQMNSKLIETILSSDTLGLLRKFDFLGYFLLLRLQTELTAMEKDNHERLLSTITFHSGTSTPGTAIPEVTAEDQQFVQELQQKLQDYYSLLNLYQQVHSSSVPQKIVLKQFPVILSRLLKVDIERTTWSHTSDLMNPFGDFAQSGPFAMTIVRLLYSLKNHRFLSCIFDLFAFCCRCFFVKPAPSENARDAENADENTADEETAEIDDLDILVLDYLSSIASGLAVFIVPSIIVGPMFALYAINSTLNRMAVLWIFALIFAAMTILLASTRPDYIFATNAAFCAVLVVFVGSTVN